MLHVAFFEPRIPGNTGSAIRLAAGTGSTLHLVEPLGFDLSEAKLRRAGLDYHEFAAIAVHDDLDAFLRDVKPARLFALSTRSATVYTEARFDQHDAVLFGPETRGLPQALLDALPAEQCLRLPMQPGNRSLNLSNAVAVVVYEAWRQMGFVGASAPADSAG